MSLLSLRGGVAPVHSTRSDVFQACDKVVRSAFAFFNVASSPIVAPVEECQPCPQILMEKKNKTQKQCSRSAGVCYFLGRGTAYGRQSRHHRRWMRLLLIPNVLINIYFNSHAVTVHRKKKKNSFWNVALILTIASVQRAVEQ